MTIDARMENSMESLISQQSVSYFMHFPNTKKRFYLEKLWGVDEREKTVDRGKGRGKEEKRERREREEKFCKTLKVFLWYIIIAFLNT